MQTGMLMKVGNFVINLWIMETDRKSNVGLCGKPVRIEKLHALTPKA